MKELSIPVQEIIIQRTRTLSTDKPGTPANSIFKPKLNAGITDDAFYIQNNTTPLRNVSLQKPLIHKSKEHEHLLSFAAEFEIQSPRTLPAANSLYISNLEAQNTELLHQLSLRNHEFKTLQIESKKQIKELSQQVSYKDKEKELLLERINENTSSSINMKRSQSLKFEKQVNNEVDELLKLINNYSAKNLTLLTQNASLVQKVNDLKETSHKYMAVLNENTFLQETSLKTQITIQSLERIVEELKERVKKQDDAIATLTSELTQESHLITNMGEIGRSLRSELQLAALTDTLSEVSKVVDTTSNKDESNRSENVLMEFALSLFIQNQREITNSVSYSTGPRPHISPNLNPNSRASRACLRNALTSVGLYEMERIQRETTDTSGNTILDAFVHFFNNLIQRKEETN